MSRLQPVFDRLRQQGRKALIPFVTAGDPSLEATVPLLEVLVIIQVGRVIGGWPTLGLLLVESAFGAWLVRREGARAWEALRTALTTGRMPALELVDAAGCSSPRPRWVPSSWPGPRPPWQPTAP